MSGAVKTAPYAPPVPCRVNGQERPCQAFACVGNGLGRSVWQERKVYRRRKVIRAERSRPLPTYIQVVVSNESRRPIGEQFCALQELLPDGAILHFTEVLQEHAWEFYRGSLQ